MAMFLDASKLYRAFQRELPEGVYADGPPTAFFTTASAYAKAVQLETVYANLQRIYDNQFPQSADERIYDWEKYAFGRFLEGSLTLQERRDLIVARFRLRPGITKQDMLDVVYSIIGNDKEVRIITWGCGEDGGWELGESQLGVTTYLNGSRLVDVTSGIYPDAEICDLTAADLGMSQDDFDQMQETAYTYEVMIYGYTLTADERTLIDSELTKREPARATHIITDGLDIADLPEGET